MDFRLRNEKASSSTMGAATSVVVAVSMGTVEGSVSPPSVLETPVLALASLPQSGPLFVAKTMVAMSRPAVVTARPPTSCLRTGD